MGTVFPAARGASVAAYCSPSHDRCLLLFMKWTASWHPGSAPARLGLITESIALTRHP